MRRIVSFKSHPVVAEVDEVSVFQKHPHGNGRNHVAPVHVHVDGSFSLFVNTTTKRQYVNVYQPPGVVLFADSRNKVAKSKLRRTLGKTGDLFVRTPHACYAAKIHVDGQSDGGFYRLRLVA